MKINKSLDIDLNIISPQKHIRIHEGDVDSVDILIGVSVDDESVDLTGVTIKYDATINNYLAEQDADGSVVDGKISIPVTRNMAAMSGLLLIDVRMIQDNQILYTQTISAIVEKSVVNGSTYIDFDKITINQRMNALEKQMEHVEEIVENFDTSKLIVSTNRPPSGAPPEIDVDLLRVGDTWILSGENIVYKLVEAQYNYQPAPGTEPYHKFTWQPLNERYGVGNTEPPTSVTYQAVIYTINEVQWSRLPVPEYFEGDQYKMLIGVDDPTYYICKSASMSSTGVCTYTWREEGGSIDAYTKAETNELLADKMDLALLNPTADEIAAMPNGQLYGDTVAHEVKIKGGQTVYDKEKLDGLFHATYVSGLLPPHVLKSDKYEGNLKIGDKWQQVSSGTGEVREFILRDIRLVGKNKTVLEWYVNTQTPMIVYGSISAFESVTSYLYDYSSMNIGIDRAVPSPFIPVGQAYISIANQGNILSLCYSEGISSGTFSGDYFTYERNYAHCAAALSTYTKTEINTMIGDIETALSEV